MPFMAWGCFLENGLDTANEGQTVSLMPWVVCLVKKSLITKWQREQMNPVTGEREMWLG